MDAQRVDMFLMANANNFESIDLPYIKKELSMMDDDKWTRIQTTQFKNPTTMLIVSLLAGTLGIDRFLIGDTGLGVGKLITCGGFGVWAIIDWFLIMGATRKKNIEKFNML
ncbi:MAG: TM2 domain-containing protein [Saprospiraceae bacterium]|nr:TM2 domain-containing protein [Saprospiraceae bacterium]